MKIDDFANQIGAWLKGEGPDSDIIISTRLRLARNVRGFVFLTYANAKQRGDIESFIKEKLELVSLPEELLAPKTPNDLGAPQAGGKNGTDEKPVRTDQPGGLIYFRMKDLTALDRQFLVERHLISQDHARPNGYRAVAIEKKEKVSIMINEEDHLRLQVIHAGLQLTEGWKEIDKIDSQIEKHIPYAFSAQFGYLTACPTNVGTGLRISVMLHLPALSMSQQIEKVLNALSRIKYTARGFYGEGTQASGDFYQISNQVSLGKSETEIINEMQNIIPEIIKFERNWRDKLLADNDKKLKDRIMRAYGILKHAETITSEEAMKHLSLVRLGVTLKVIKDIAIKTIN